MDKKRLIAFIIGAILVIGMTVSFYLQGEKPEDNIRTVTKDSKQFKEEFESLNGKTDINDEK